MTLLIISASSGALQTFKLQKKLFGLTCCYSTFVFVLYISSLEVMADDTRDNQSGTAAATGGSTTTAPPKKFPKGVVLGKDGKP
jgi:hypothetical protein